MNATNTAGLSADELKRMKRDASIKAKEDEFERRRKEQEEEKRQQLEKLKQEAEDKENNRRLKRIENLHRSAHLRHEKEMADQARDEKRTKKINAKNEAWKVKANGAVAQLLAAKDKEDEFIEANKEEARERKRDAIERKKQAEREEQERQMELDMNRDEKNAERHTQRELREVHRVDTIKTEATEELEAFIIHPAPMPLRQVLAGTKRPVPKVTELLACYKDQREDIEDLEEQDIPMRAQLRNMSIFSYVTDIQKKSEDSRLKPPEPIPSDIHRGGMPKPGPKSPKSPGRGKKGSSSPTGRR